MTERKPAIKVYVIETAPIVALGLEVLLEKSPDMEFAGLSTPDAFNPTAGDKRPDVVLVDAINAEPARIIDRISKAWRRTAVLAFTPNDVPNFDFRPWLRVGAAGGISKGSSLSQLVQAIRAVSRGETYNYTRTSGNKGDKRRRASLGALTDREKRVLSLIAQGMTAREAATVMDVSSRTIETHVRTIFLKMNVNSRAHAVSQAIAEGLIETPPPKK